LNLSEIQVSAGALRHNVALLRRHTGDRKTFIAVVKGNAYGHGLESVVSAIETEVDGFQVDDLDELRVLRPLTRKRILVLGYVPRDSIVEVAELGGELALYDTDRLALLAAAGVPVHLKVDALLGRQGVLPEDLDGFLTALRAHPELRVLSAYGHFANIEDTTDLVHAEEQIATFEDAFAKIASQYPGIGRHLSATSGLLTVERSNDLVRIGIGTYGMYPSVSLDRRYAEMRLRPALRWVSHLAQVKTLPARHPIGYGLTYVTSRETRIGIVPQGYSDGYDRGLSNVGEVLVQGRRCSVLGRVAMNMFAADLTEVPSAKAEDEVVLLGEQAGERITAEEIASRLGTINYEVTTRLSALLPRRLVP